MGNIKQQGVVLVAALVMILLVTGIAVTVLSSSSLDTKMVVASQQAYSAENITKGDAERAIKAEIDLDGDSRLLYRKGKFPESNKIDISTNLQSEVMLSRTNINENVDLIDCPPRFAVTKGIKCNYLNTRTVHKYGKNKRYEMIVNTGVQQELIAN